MIVSHKAFMIFVTLMVIGIGAGWGGWSLIDLKRVWKTRKEEHDRFFGAIIGFGLAFTGLIGLAKYYLFPAPPF